jgi:hypothetical protein
MNSLDLTALLILVIGFITVFCILIPSEEQPRRSFVISETYIPMTFKKRMNFNTGNSNKRHMQNRKRPSYFRKHRH